VAKLILTKKSNPCPICGDTSGRCRTQDHGPLVLCGNRGKGDAPIGYRYVKQSTGIWNVFAPDSQSDDWQGRLDERVERDRIKAEREAIERSALPSLESRHALLSAKPHTLTPNQNSDLLKRGLTQSEIDDCLSRGLLWQERGGYGIGAIDPVTGFIVGGQMARDDRNPKYQWLLPGRTHLPETGQNPLAVWVSPNFDRTKPYSLHLCDAFLKPLICGIKAWRIDPQQIWVGRGGGQFQNEALERVLSCFPDGDLGFYPDGGDFKNANTVQAFRELEAFAKSKKLTLTVAWWDQWTKEDPDCDELTGSEDVRILTPAEYLRFCFKETQGDLKNWQASKVLTSDDTIDSQYFEYPHPKSGEIFGAKAGLGNGKTHYFGEALQKKAQSNPELRAIVLAPTNTLCDGVQGRLQKDWGLTSCHPKNVDFGALQKSGEGAIVVCCPDSIAAIPLWFSHGAFLVVDEAVSCQNALTTRVSIDHRSEAIKLVRYAVKHCDRALLFDGHLTDKTLAWYQYGTERSIFKVENIRKGNTYSEYLYLNKKQWDTSLDSQDILTSPIALAGDTLQIQDYVKASLEQNLGAKGKVLCSKTAHEAWVPELTSNATSFILKSHLNIFAFSPSAESGVDISTENYFGAVYGRLTGVIGPDAQSQILGRVREPVDRHVYCNTVGNWDEMAAGATTATAAHTALNDLLLGLGKATLEGTDRAALIDKFSHLLTENLATNEAAFDCERIAIANIEKKNLLACHIMRALESGHTVKIVGGDFEESALSSAVSACTEERKTEIAKRVQGALLVEEAEIKALKQSRKPRTPEQDAMCDRFFLEKRLPGIGETDIWNDVTVCEDPKCGQVAINVEFVRELLESDVIGSAENWYAYQNSMDSKRSELDHILRCLETGKIDLTRKSRFGRVKAIKDAGFDRVLEIDGEFTGKHSVIVAFLWNFRKSLPSHGMKIHKDPVRGIKDVCKFLGLAVNGRRTETGRFYQIDKLSYEESLWKGTVYRLIEEKRRLIAENHAVKDAQALTNSESETVAARGFEHDTTACNSFNIFEAVVSSHKAPDSSPPDLTEWRDFITSERQKFHTPEAIRAMSSQMGYVPSGVWEAIAA
jgi:hypothetical protein